MGGGAGAVTGRIVAPGGRMLGTWPRGRRLAPLGFAALASPRSADARRDVAEDRSVGDLAARRVLLDNNRLRPRPDRRPSGRSRTATGASNPPSRDRRPEDLPHRWRLACARRPADCASGLERGRIRCAGRRTGSSTIRSGEHIALGQDPAGLACERPEAGSESSRWRRITSARPPAPAITGKVIAQRAAGGDTTRSQRPLASSSGGHVAEVDFDAPATPRLLR